MFIIEAFVNAAEQELPLRCFSSGKVDESDTSSNPTSSSEFVPVTATINMDGRQ
jgi:hypothetical protein